MSLSFHLFFLNLTYSCPYSCNLMLTATYMFRPYITLNIHFELYRVETCKFIDLAQLSQHFNINFHTVKWRFPLFINTSFMIMFHVFIGTVFQFSWMSSRGRHYRDRMVVGYDVMSSNLDQGEVYNIMWYSLSGTCDRSVVFYGSSGFLQ